MLSSRSLAMRNASVACTGWAAACKQLIILYWPCMWGGNGMHLSPSLLRDLEKSGLRHFPSPRPSYGACKQLAAEVVAADAPCSASPCALGTPQVG